MKIIHIVHSLRGGGIQNFIVSLASEQVKQKNDVTVIVIDKYNTEYCNHLESILKSNNVNVIKLDKIQGNKFSLIKAILKCRKIIQKEKPDIINTHGEISHLYGALCTILTKIPQVITVHSAKENWNFIINYFCQKKPLIFCSNSTKFDLQRKPNHITTSINNGISKDIIQSHKTSNLRKEYKLREQDKIIILVGSFRPAKNYLFLKDLVDELKQDETYHFFVCGGKDVSNKDNIIETLKDYKTIHFLGLRSDISDIENESDLFLSCATFEGLPIAVLEAYFNGIPCILSPIEQHIKISNIEKVWIPEDFTATSFVKAIKLAINESNYSHEYIYKMREKQLEQYSITETANQYERFYKKIISTNKLNV